MSSTDPYSPEILFKLFKELRDDAERRSQEWEELKQQWAREKQEREAKEAQFLADQQAHEQAREQKQLARERNEQARLEKEQARLEKEQAEWKKQQAEREAREEKEQAEWKKQQAEREAREEKEQAEWKKQQAEREAREEKASAQLRAEIKAVNKMMGKYGLIQGKTAEESVYRSLATIFQKRGKTFHRIERNIKVHKEGKPFAEFDVLAVNKGEVLPVEVKSKLSQADIDHFIDVQLPKFKVSFPEFVDYKLLAGVGSLNMSQEVENYALDKGLYVFIQHGETMDLANPIDFEPKVFA